MKTFLLLTGLLLSNSAWSAQVTFECQPRLYTCRNLPNGPTCRWENFGRAYLETQPLRRVSENLWESRYEARWDRHVFVMDIYYEIIGDRPFFDIEAFLSNDTVAAESNGDRRLQLSLRDSRRGRGFSCYGFRVQN